VAVEVSAFLGCDGVYFGRQIPVFWRKFQLPFSGEESVSPNPWYITSQPEDCNPYSHYHAGLKSHYVNI